jgi:hypothetical protein
LKLSKIIGGGRLVRLEESIILESMGGEVVDETVQRLDRQGEPKLQVHI